MAAWYFLRSNGHQMASARAVPAFLVGVARSEANTAETVNDLIRKIAGWLRMMVVEPQAVGFAPARNNIFI